MHVAVVAVSLSVFLGAATAAHAADHPIAGAELRVKRSNNGTERLVFSSKDAPLLPVPGGADDPASGAPGGATIELFSQGAVSTVSFSAPRDTTDPGWRGAASRQRYRHAAAPDAVSALASIRLHDNGGLRIVGRRAGLALDGHEQRVGIRITMGTIRHCALFEPATVKRDEPGTFLAAGAPASALADCSDAALAPPPPVPGCGDGVIDTGEDCDGDALGICGDVATACGAPGFSTECRCCSTDGWLVTIVGCCNPSAVAVSFGPAGSGLCAPLRCDAPYTCGANAECLPDGNCCGRQNQPCYFSLTQQLLQPCCDGLVCGRPDPGGVLYSCCTPQNGACARNGDCCSDSCGASGVCD